jgi:hypothetical protein
VAIFFTLPHDIFLSGPDTSRSQPLAAREQRPLGAERAPPTANARSADPSDAGASPSQERQKGRIRGPRAGAAQEFAVSL